LIDEDGEVVEKLVLLDLSIGPSPAEREAASQNFFVKNTK